VEVCWCWLRQSKGLNEAKKNLLPLYLLMKLMQLEEPGKNNMSGSNDERENTLNQLLTKWMVWHKYKQ
jgi:ATP-dependent Zn protease